MTVSVFAPAKINLTLHVTGQRDDGYHLIDSLVAFAPVGDRLTINDAGVSSLMVKGPEAAGVPADIDNLVMKAAGIVAPGRGLAITLEKNLPIASGIGGGSSDAAAAVRGLLVDCNDDAWFGKLAAMDDASLATVFRPTFEKILRLGADIPMCLLPRQQRVRGIGEIFAPANFPDLPAILVNPRVAVSTQDVFEALDQKTNPPMDAEIPDFAGPVDFCNWLSMQRNDLERPARQLCPEIGEVLGIMEQTSSCLLARMSGSGATCFAIFPTTKMAHTAARSLRQDHPKWWIHGGMLGSWAEKSAPILS